MCVNDAIPSGLAGTASQDVRNAQSLGREISTNGWWQCRAAPDGHGRHELHGFFSVSASQRFSLCFSDLCFQLFQFLLLLLSVVSTCTGDILLAGGGAVVAG